MPYIIKKKSSRWCVYKETEQGSGEAMGDPLGCHDTEEQAKEQLRAVYAAENREKDDKDEKGAGVLVFQGGEIKAIEGGPEGLVGGYLVRFGGEDLDGECFDADTDFGSQTSTAVLYHHGLDKALKLRPIGQGTLTIDDVGVWIEAQLDMADEYVKYLYERGIMKGRFGWSSGTASHLVERETIAGKVHIKRWPLGLDASITPTPAEPRNVAVSLKTIMEADLTPEAAEAAGEVKAEAVEPVTEPETKTDNLHMEGKTMPEITREEIAAIVAEQIKAAQPDGVTGVVATKAAPAVNTNPHADSLKTAFLRFVRTGDIGAGNEVNAEMKTEYPWNEATAAEGAVLVPTELYNGIFMKVHEASIMRQAGAEIVNVSSNKITLPAEGTAETAMTATDEAGAYNENTTQPLASISLAPHKWTRFMKVSNELLRDSYFSVESFLASRIASAWALMENTEFVTGTGDGDPDIQGLVTGGTAGLTFDSASTIGAAEIPELLYKLKAQYQDRAVFVMRGATLGLLAGLTGNPFYFYPGGANSTLGISRPTLMGKPVFLTDGAAAIAASAKSVYVGDPFQYVIGQCGGLVIQRNPYLYMANGQVGFFADVRIGGAVKQAEGWQYGTHPTA